MTQPNLLELVEVSVTRRAAAAAFRLDVPTLALHEGGRLALLGLSGAGKSTLLNLLALALRPTSASQFVFCPQGLPINVEAAWRGAAHTLDSLRAHHIGYVMQTGGLLDFLSVRENIELPSRICGEFAGGRVEALAHRLGIAAQLDKPPTSLSVGQRQRVAIARALVHAPRLVLADEPTSALDSKIAGQVMDLLLAETATSGAALVVATHDRAMVTRLALPSVVLDAAACGTSAVARWL